MAIWNKRNPSRYLWCTFVIAIFGACGAFIYWSIFRGTEQFSSYQSSRNYFSSPEKISEEQCIPICDTKECIYQSKLLLDYMKPDVNPCEDFYEFACGQISEKFDPKENFTIVHRYGDVVISRVKNILDKIEEDTRSASGKMKTVYHSCIKHSSSEFQAVPTALEVLDNFGIKSWPNLASDFKFENRSLSRVIANFLLYNEYGFIEFSARSAYMELEEFDVKVNTSLLNAKSYYERQDKPSRKYLVNRVLNYFDLDSETINSILEESEAIRDAIINLRQESESRNSTTTFLHCAQNTEIEWKDLCETLKSLIEIGGAVDDINKDFASIESGEMYFMQNIFPVLRNFTDRSIANYLALNIFLNNLDELNYYFYLTRKTEKEDDESIVREPILKWKKCISWIMRYMPFALGNEYMKNDLTGPMIREVQDLGEECIRNAGNLISQQEWMTKEYRALLKEKNENLKFEFDVMVELLTNETEVNEFYEMIEYHPTDGSFLRNVLELKKSTRISEMRGMRRSWWIRHLFEVAAYGGDVIELQFGLLIPPTYLPGAQRIMNLISLGGIISHEIGHNLNRLLAENSELDPKATEHFEENINCLVNHYSQFMIESIGKNLNGNLTLEENLPDIIAVSVVDKLITKYLADNSVNPLPSSSYSLRQQLYIYAGQVWCSASSKERDEDYYKTNTHSLERFRLRGMMQNSKGFSEAFGCPEGSYMNPATKCLLLK